MGGGARFSTGRQLPSTPGIAVRLGISTVDHWPGATYERALARLLYTATRGGHADFTAYGGGVEWRILTAVSPGRHAVSSWHGI